MLGALSTGKTAERKEGIDRENGRREWWDKEMGRSAVLPTVCVCVCVVSMIVTV